MGDDGMIGFRIVMEVPDLESYKRTGINRAHRAAAEAVTKWFISERLKLRDRNRLGGQLRWQKRAVRWKVAKQRIRPGSGDIPHRFTGHTMERLNKAQPFRRGKKFGVKITGLNPGYSRRRKPGRPPMRDELGRMTAQERRQASQIYGSTFARKLNDDPKAKKRSTAT